MDDTWLCCVLVGVLSRKVFCFVNCKGLDLDWIQYPPDIIRLLAMVWG